MIPGLVVLLELSVSRRAREPVLCSSSTSAASNRLSSSKVSLSFRRRAVLSSISLSGVSLGLFLDESLVVLVDGTDGVDVSLVVLVDAVDGIDGSLAVLVDGVDGTDGICESR